MLKEKEELLNIIKRLEGESLKNVKIFIDGMEAGKFILSELPGSIPAQAPQALGALSGAEA